MADYSGSFNGSFQGTISGSLLGSGIVSSSTQIDGLFNIDGLISSSAQIAALGSGIVSSSTQIDFNSIVNKPTTIQPFQANSITSNNQFRQVTFPAFSSSVSTDLISLESSVSTLSGQVQAAVSGTVPPGTISGSTQISEFGYILSSQTSSFVLSSQTSSMSVLNALTASFISDIFISASAVRSGFGTALFPSGLLSSSFQIANDISGAFTSLSSSFQSRINSLEVGGGSSIFKLTGSFYSTTNNIQITGSLSISSGSFKSFEVDSDGFVVLGDTSIVNKDLNNAPVGTIAYSASSFYLIS